MKKYYSIQSAVTHFDIHLSHLNELQFWRLGTTAQIFYILKIGTFLTGCYRLDVNPKICMIRLCI